MKTRNDMSSLGSSSKKKKKKYIGSENVPFLDNVTDDDPMLEYHPGGSSTMTKKIPTKKVKHANKPYIKIDEDKIVNNSIALKKIENQANKLIQDLGNIRQFSSIKPIEFKQRKDAILKFWNGIVESDDQRTALKHLLEKKVPTESDVIEKNWPIHLRSVRKENNAAKKHYKKEGNKLTLTYKPSAVSLLESDIGESFLPTKSSIKNKYNAYEVIDPIQYLKKRKEYPTLGKYDEDVNTKRAKYLIPRARKRKRSTIRTEKKFARYANLASLKD